jgi:hypothetical protein
MAHNFPPDTEIAGWLATLGVASRCQWDVLVFLYRHQTTLLDAAHLAGLLGYASNAIVVALDVLASLDLVVRSRVSQGARLYQFSVAPGSPRGAAFARLQPLTTHRADRVRVAQQLRQDPPPGETLQAAQGSRTHTQDGGRGAWRPARAERRHTWLQAI